MRLKLAALACLLAVLVLSMRERTRLVEATGNRFQPIRFYFMPFRGEHTFARYAPSLEAFIKAHTGLEVQAMAAPDFMTTIKAFSAGSADIAFMNTLGYLMAREWTRAQAHLRLEYDDGRQSYRGQLIVRRDSGLRELRDLQGKTIAFSDPFSAGGYLYPLKLLSQQGVKPATVVFAKGHADAVGMVYRREVDAAATYAAEPNLRGEPQDARIEVRGQYPDVVSEVVVLTETEAIPNGVVALRRDLAPEIQTKLVGSLMEFARTPDGAEALQALYNVTGLSLADDAEYDAVRATLQQLGKTSAELVPGGVSFYKLHVEAGLTD